MAHYSFYPVRVRLLERQAFCDLGVFSKFVSDTSIGAFYIKANRDKFRDTYSSLLGRAPFCRVARFPSDEFYVHLTNKNLERYVQAVLAAIDLPDRQIEKGKLLDVNLSDAKRNFDVNVSALKSIVNSLEIDVLVEYGIYCQETFESLFNLEWVDICV